MPVVSISQLGRVKRQPINAITQQGIQKCQDMHIAATEAL